MSLAGSRLGNYRWVALATTPLLCLGTLYFLYYRRSRKPHSPAEKPAAKESSASDLKLEGNVLFAEGRFQEALEKYEQVLRICKDGREDDGNSDIQPQVLQNMAAVLEKLGDLHGAISHLTKALSCSPRYVKALHRRGRLYHQLGFLDESLEDITSACLLDNFRSAGPVALADEILKKIGERESLKLLEDRGRRLEPSRHTVKSYLRGFVNCPLGKLLRGEEEEQLSEKVRKLVKSERFEMLAELQDDHDHDQNESTMAAYVRASFRFLYGYPDVGEEFRKVANDTQMDSQVRACALVKLASQAAINQGANESADSGDNALGMAGKLFAEAEKVLQNNPDVYFHRGQVYLSLGHYERALADLSQASSLTSNPLPTATKLYVQFKLLPESQASVLEEFQRLASEIPASFPDVHALLGQLLLMSGDEFGAERSFRQTLTLDPDNSTVLVHRALHRMEQGLEHEALQILQQGKQRDPQNEFILETLGTMQLQKGNLSEALENLNSAINCARAPQELRILTSLRAAAAVQQKVRAQLGL